MVIKLRAFKLKKNKGKAEHSALKATTSVGDDLSYLHLATIVLGSTLHCVSLEIDTRVPLKPMGSLGHRALKILRLTDREEKDAKGGEVAPLRAQRRTRRRR